MIWNYLLIIILVALNGFLGHLDQMTAVEEEINPEKGVEHQVTVLDEVRIFKVLLKGV